MRILQLGSLAELGELGQPAASNAFDQEIEQVVRELTLGLDQHKSKIQHLKTQNGNGAFDQEIEQIERQTL